jgi:hypothetical protein
MKAYSQFLKELPSKKIVFAFGRFQPPTTGHELLVKAVEKLAKEQNAAHVIYASHTQDKSKNPLPVDRKVYYLKRMFPEANFKAAGGTTRTFIEVAKELNKKYKNIIMIAGSDRVAEYKKLLDKYNGTEFKFDTISVVSAGERDPDADNASGMSGTKMREAAKKGDFELFKKGLPHTLTSVDGKRLMNEIREGMGMDPIKEQIKLATDWLRESYFRGEIYKIGQFVESNGKRFEIIDRGSNYVTVVDSNGNTSRKWITDVVLTEDYNVPHQDLPSSDDDTTQISYKGYRTKHFESVPDAFVAFHRTTQKPDVDPVAVLNALKHTDRYLEILKQIMNSDYIDDNQKLEFNTNLQKAQEYLFKTADLQHHVEYINSVLHMFGQVEAQYHLEKEEQMEESMKTFKQLVEMKFTSSDKIKVARIIADALGVPDVEKTSNAEQLLNNALRKVKNKPLRAENIAIIKNMLQTAKEAGIAYDEKLVPQKVEEGYEDIATSDFKLDKHGKKVHRKLRFKTASKVPSDDVTEETTVNELSNDLLARYKKKAADQASAADKVGDYAKGNKRFSGIIKATKKQFDNDLKKEEAEQIDEISQKLAGNYYGAATKKHIDKVGVKANMYDRIEKDMGKQRKAGVDRALDRVTGARKTNEETGNDIYDRAQEHLSKANDADAKGDKKSFHAHMADHHDAMSEWHDSKGRSASADKHAEKADYHHEKSLSEEVVSEATPYYNKPSFLKKMSRVAKQERQAREKKEAEQKKPVKEEVEIEICETADAGLAAKAEKSGISIGTLRKVYRRGVAAWNSGHRPGTTPQQWGMARVNSYIGKGKGTYHGADKDLREGDTSNLPRVAKDKETGLPKKYVAGLSASTAKARAAHWKEKDKLSDSDPRAYEPAPGDATAKTKPSKHTLKYKAMFGEDMEEEILEACWVGYKQVGLKKKGNRMVPNCVKEDIDYELAIRVLEEAISTIDKGEYDYEGAMARTQLQTVVRNAQDLINMLSMDDNMPEWVQSKITLAQDYISSVRDYLQSRQELGEECECDKPEIGTTGKLTYDSMKRFLGIQTVAEPSNKKSSFNSMQKRYMNEEEEEIDDSEFDDEISKMSEPEHIIDAYDDDELAIVDDETGEELDTSGYVDDDSEEEAKLKEGKIVILEISRMERIRRKQRFARTQSKREVRAQIALRKTSNQSTINKRSRRLAISMIKKRMLRKDPSKATMQEKERVEAFISKRKDIVDRLSRRVAPRVRQIEKARLQHRSFTK